MTGRDRLRGHLKAWFVALHQERDVSSHTFANYKTAWELLLRFGVQRGLPASRDWLVAQVNRPFVLEFLVYLERERRCSVSTRNNRLAAIQSFFHWLRSVEPNLHRHCTQILGIPVKRAHRPLIDYLERSELQAVLEAVDLQQPDGLRNLTLLCFAYNTGARVSEMAQLRIAGLQLDSSPTARFWGKRRKQRELPLWQRTAQLLRTYLNGHRRPPTDTLSNAYLFLNHRGQRMTRWGVAGVIEGAMQRATVHSPTMAGKRLSAHSMRHTTAVHLLQSGVDLVTIQHWLGHDSPESVHVYLALDLKSRRDLLERCLNLDAFLNDYPDGDDWLAPV